MCATIQRGYLIEGTVYDVRSTSCTFQVLFAHLLSSYSCVRGHAAFEFLFADVHLTTRHTLLGHYTEFIPWF